MKNDFAILREMELTEVERSGLILLIEIEESYRKQDFESALKLCDQFERQYRVTMLQIKGTCMEDVVRHSLIASQLQSFYIAEKYNQKQALEYLKAGLQELSAIKYPDLWMKSKSVVRHAIKHRLLDENDLRAQALKKYDAEIKVGLGQ